MLQLHFISPCLLFPSPSAAAVSPRIAGFRLGCRNGSLDSPERPIIGNKIYSQGPFMVGQLTQSQDVQGQKRECCHYGRRRSSSLCCVLGAFRFPNVNLIEIYRHICIYEIYRHICIYAIYTCKRKHVTSSKQPELRGANWLCWLQKTMMLVSVPQLAKQLKLLFLDTAALTKPRLCFGVCLCSAGKLLLVCSTCSVSCSEAQAELKSLAMHGNAGKTTVGTVACRTISHPDQQRMFFTVIILSPGVCCF